MLSGDDVMRAMDFMNGMGELFGMIIEPQKPERPFPLRPGTGFAAGFLQDDGYPVKDENDLIYMGNNLWGRLVNHDAFMVIFDGLMEGDFHGR